MINSKTSEYYRHCYSAYLSEYITQKTKQNKKLRWALIAIMLFITLAILGFYKPIFATSHNEINQKIDTERIVYLQKNFEENIKNKYAGAYVTFPNNGIAHIKKTKYINKKPIKINIVELNTNVNPYLKIKPQIATNKKLNSKTTVRKIAQKENAIVAINGGYFKPQTGIPLGALMIDGKVLSGALYNRVGLAIFEEKNKTYFKLANINFDIKAITSHYQVKIDNINQPRLISSQVLLYTPIWGQYAPKSATGASNILIRGNKIEKTSINEVLLEKNCYVIQAPNSIIAKLKQNKEIYINIKPQEELKNAKHIIGAGPYLIKNSEIYVDYKEQKLQAIAGKNPRSAIGFKNDGTLIIVTVDGREKTSVGMTLSELAKLMKELDCEYAMNFDGGSSSALYVKSKIVNSAVNKEGIAVSNALTISEYLPEMYTITSSKTPEINI